MKMNVGIISAYVIFLVINLIVNFVTAWMITAKKLSLDSNVVHVINVVQSLLSLFFTIAIIRIAVKSGFKA
jgi:hypothetical protein